MKLPLVCCFIILMFLGTLCLNGEEEKFVREKVSFNEGWLFQKGDPAAVKGAYTYSLLKPWLLPSGNAFRAASAPVPKGNPPAAIAAALPEWNDQAWRRLNLPHDWAIEGPFNLEAPGETGKLPYAGVGWYRKKFSLPSTDQGREIHLKIDGAMSYAAVWLNGQWIGGWPYGYTSFQLNLTPFIKIGAENVLAIRVDNPPDSSRWYPGAGIYRNVWLEKVSPLHVAQGRTAVTTPVIQKDFAQVQVATMINNHYLEKEQVEVRQEIFACDQNGTATGAALVSGKASLSIEAGKNAALQTSLRLPDPHLWSLQHTQRYQLTTTVLRNGKPVDIEKVLFGVRTIEFNAERGFLLNGEKVRINGVCNHHDLGALGGAVNISALERQIKILQEMGSNAIRTSHNPPAPELLELCDRMGMLVMVEAFDCWRKGKKPNDYHVLFPDWAEADVRSMVRRDRNHPSVILWSIGNEIPDQLDVELTRELMSYVRLEDTTRLVTQGYNNVDSGFKEVAGVIDVFGYNYKPQTYAAFRRNNPKTPLYGSETASTMSSRGEYFFPIDEIGTNFQVNSYDLTVPGWATTPDLEFEYQDSVPGVAGEFVWTGFDYLGEPTPYNSDVTNLLNFTDPEERAKMKAELDRLGRLPSPARSSYFGIVDLSGFKKDRFYLYQSRWLPELPMVHIMPHWNWPERAGKSVPVQIYTSGDEAELFLNSESLGRRKKQSLESVAQAWLKPVNISASSQTDAGETKLAFDGLNSTGWIPKSGEASPWLQIDWGSVQPIRQIQVQFQGVAKDYQHDLFYSEDGEIWTLAAQKHNKRGGSGPWVHEVNLQARYLKIVILPTTEAKTISIREFKASSLPAKTEIYRLRWDDVKYAPGELRVVAYKAGKPWAEKTIRTTGKAAQIALSSDRSTISSDGKELSFITVSLEDANGAIDPLSDQEIEFGISGPGEIVATDNGDATDLVSFSSTRRKAFNGLALLIVRAKAGETGTIQISARAKALKEGKLSIVSESK